MVTDKDLVAVGQACDLVEAAHRAQAELARFDQEKIDRICEAMVRAALHEARRLGAMAVEETGYGVAADGFTHRELRDRKRKALKRSAKNASGAKERKQKVDAEPETKRRR